VSPSDQVPRQQSGSKNGEPLTRVSQPSSPRIELLKGSLNRRRGCASRSRRRARVACRSRDRHGPEQLLKLLCGVRREATAIARFFANAARPGRCLAGDVARTRSFARQASFQIADRKSNTAKATAKPAIEIQKTEMQPCGKCHGNGARLRNVIVQEPAPEICARAGFFERKDKSRLRHPIPIGKWDGTIATNKGNAQ
jgi:hypothetical protein